MSARTGFLALLFLLVARDPLGMLGARKTSWQWPRDISLPIVAAAAAGYAAASWSGADPSERVRLRQGLTRAWPALGTVVLSIISIRWSLSPQRTIGDLSWLVASTFLAVAVAARFRMAQLLDALTILCGGILGVSAVLARSSHYRSEEGFWIGVYGNRNGLGAIAALAIPIFWYFGVGVRGNRHRVRAGLASLLTALALSTVLKTGSRTSLGIAVVLLVTCAGLETLRFTRNARTRSVPTASAGRTAVAVTGVLVVLAGIARFASVAPIDRTLTMRTDMWSTLLPVANRQWWHGYGYGGFWSGERGYLLGAQFRSGAGPALATAHNGFLQEYLSTGVLGVALSVALFIVLFSRFLPLLRRDVAGPGTGGGFRQMPSSGERLRANDFCLTVTVGILLLNLTEAMMSSPLSLPWFLLVMIAALPDPDGSTRTALGSTLVTTDGSAPSRGFNRVPVPVRIGALLLVVLGVGFAARAPYDATLAHDDFAAAADRYAIAPDPATDEALNRLGLVYDRRRDLRLAFGLDDLRVRDLLEWVVTSDDADAKSLSRFLPVYRRVIAQIDR